jgi:hypothetical protein
MADYCQDALDGSNEYQDTKSSNSQLQVETRRRDSMKREQHQRAEITPARVVIPGEHELIRRGKRIGIAREGDWRSEIGATRESRTGIGDAQRQTRCCCPRSRSPSRAYTALSSSEKERGRHAHRRPSKEAFGLRRQCYPLCGLSPSSARRATNIGFILTSIWAICSFTRPHAT